MYFCWGYLHGILTSFRDFNLQFLRQAHLETNPGFRSRHFSRSRMNSRRKSCRNPKTHSCWNSTIETPAVITGRTTGEITEWILERFPGWMMEGTLPKELLMKSQKTFGWIKRKTFEGSPEKNTRKNRVRNFLSNFRKKWKSSVGTTKKNNGRNFGGISERASF